MNLFDYERKYFLIKHMQKYKDANDVSESCKIIMQDQIDRLFSEVKERLRQNPNELKAERAAYKTIFKKEYKHAISKRKRKK